MAIADRKHRERLQRKLLFIEHADMLLRQHGYLGLNLDQLAERVEYSKATLYNHFVSKEDLVLAVTNWHMQRREMFFTRALTFDGRPRERMFVVGVADTILAKEAPHSFALAQFVRTPSIWERTDPAHQQSFFQHSEQCIRVALEVIRQGRGSGDLPVEAPANEQILAGLVSLAKGAHLLADDPIPAFEAAGIHPTGSLFANYHLFLDGAQWKPLSSCWDYADTLNRIEREAFPHDAHVLHE